MYPGVASGAIVVAVCTSHDGSKTGYCSAHSIVNAMEQVCVAVDGKFTVVGMQ